MKVVLVGPIYPYRGGIAHFTAALADALENQAVETTIISYRKLYPKFLYPGKDDKDLGEHSPDPKVKFIYSPFDFRDWQATWRLIKEVSPKILMIVVGLVIIGLQIRALIPYVTALITR